MYIVNNHHSVLLIVLKTDNILNLVNKKRNLTNKVPFLNLIQNNLEFIS